MKEWRGMITSGSHFFIISPWSRREREFPVAVFPMCETEIGQAKTPPHNTITRTKKHTDSIRSNDNQILTQERRAQMPGHKEIFWLATIRCEKADKLQEIDRRTYRYKHDVNMYI